MEVTEQPPVRTDGPSLSRVCTLNATDFLDEHSASSEELISSTIKVNPFSDSDSTDAAMPILWPIKVVEASPTEVKNSTATCPIPVAGTSSTKRPRSEQEPTVQKNKSWNKWRLGDPLRSDTLPPEQKTNSQLKQFGEPPSLVSDVSSPIEKFVFMDSLRWLDYATILPDDSDVSRAPIAIECFGGSARLTWALIQEGFDGLSVDWLRNKSRPEGPTTLLDLTSEHGRNIIRQSIRSGRLAFLHFAPPCGTCSRAREIPLSIEALRRGMRTPQPLRSAEWPDGLPQLKGLDCERVQSANALYQTTAELCILATSYGIAWSIENPRSSWYWQTSFTAKLIDQLDRLQQPAIWTEFQSCAYGGARPKWTALLHTIPEFKELEGGVCPGVSDSHHHKPWGTTDSNKFATADEAAYPRALCIVMAKLVRKHVTARGLPFDDNITQMLRARNSVTGVQAAEAGRQSRGAKAPRLIPEYASIKKFRVSCEKQSHAIEGQVLCKPLTTMDGTIPAGAKIMRTSAPGKEGERALFAALPWTKDEFIKKALNVKHPVDSTTSLEDDIYRNIFWLLTEGHVKANQFRLDRLSDLERWKSELELSEKKLHSTIDPESENILKSKNICLFSRVLQEIGHADKNLVDRMTKGFQLTGHLEESGVFAKRDPKNRNPISREDLLRSSSWSRQIFAASVGPSEDAEMDAEIYRITKDEIEAKLLVGPFTTSDLDSRHGGSWIAARRFGIRQGSKIRQIDDFSVFGQNNTISADETVALGGVDAVVNIAKNMVGAVQDDRSVVVPSAKDGQLTGVLHSDWSVPQARTILAQCVDLKSAYKQLVRHKDDAAISIISVWNTDLKRVDLFESVGLPFGSSGSVYGFNRCSFALRQVFIRFFRMTLTSFFDDFPWLEYGSMAEVTAGISKRTFELFGWDVSVEKLKAFSSSFEALGVQFDLGGLPSKGNIVISNTPKRKAAVSKEIRDILRAGFLAQHQAASLRGRLLYGEAQHWGRIMSLTTQLLAQRAQGMGCGIIDHELSEALEMAKWIMENSSPRTLFPWTRGEKCNIVFVDAAAEDVSDKANQLVTIGAVIFSERLAAPEFFGFTLSPEVVAHWQSTGSKQVIAQAELTPIIIAKWVWKRVLSHSKNIFFQDNESARECLIRSYSPVWSSRQLIVLSKIADASSNAIDWYARVPTSANVADGPSRLDFTHVNSIGAVQVHVSSPRLEQIYGFDVIERLSQGGRP